LVKRGADSGVAQLKQTGTTRYSARRAVAMQERGRGRKPLDKRKEMEGILYACQAVAYGKQFLKNTAQLAAVINT